MNPPASTGDARDVSWIPGVERPPGRRMAPPSSILAWKIPRTEEHGGLQSVGLQRVGYNLATKQQQHVNILID